jgi:AcrR family transcriptional regulator
MSTTTPIPTQSQQKPEDRRTVILDAALELFTRQGYDATSIDQIRIASGFKSKASLYTHFNSKEEISTALIAKVLGKIQQIVMKAEQSADSKPLARFTSVFRAYIEWGLTHHCMRRACTCGSSTFWSHCESNNIPCGTFKMRLYFT